MTARQLTLPVSKRHRLAALRARMWMEPTLAARYARDPDGVLAEYDVPVHPDTIQGLTPPPADALTIQSLASGPNSAFSACFCVTLCSVPPPGRDRQPEKTAPEPGEPD
ncbi:MAG TPA: hypothetical protein VH912_01345 [Streptosporangiaceae bacterium]